MENELRQPPHHRHNPPPDPRRIHHRPPPPSRPINIPRHALGGSPPLPPRHPPGLLRIHEPPPHNPNPPPPPPDPIPPPPQVTPPPPHCRPINVITPPPPAPRPTDAAVVARTVPRPGPSNESAATFNTDTTDVKVASNTARVSPTTRAASACGARYP